MFNKKFITLFLIFFVLIVFNPLYAQEKTTTNSQSPQEYDEDYYKAYIPPPAPPDEVKAYDTPNDKGSSITIEWKLSTDDDGSGNIVTGYEIQRAESPQGPWKTVKKLPPKTNKYIDFTKENENWYVENYKDYYYKVLALGLGYPSESRVVGPVQAKPQWFHTGKTPILVATILFTIFVIFYIQLARKNPNIFIRPIAGIEAIDDAIGRATEMGKPILYVLGLGGPSDIATIASYTILNRVAKKTAEYQTDLIVPCNDPLVMMIAREVVRSAYLDAGRPDLFNPEEMVYFVTTMQFAYVAAVNGIMIRRKTATNFYVGTFYAESLLLAETGNIAGSIQIAGTDRVAQLPFFITACDYTLIGEELYAASAYLGRDPILLGTLKAQDLGKAILMVWILVGSLLLSLFGSTFLKDIIALKF